MLELQIVLYEERLNELGMLTWHVWVGGHGKFFLNKCKFIMWKRDNTLSRYLQGTILGINL